MEVLIKSVYTFLFCKSVCNLLWMSGIIQFHLELGYICDSTPPNEVGVDKNHFELFKLSYAVRSIRFIIIMTFCLASNFVLAFVLFCLFACLFVFLIWGHSYQISTKTNWWCCGKESPEYWQWSKGIKIRTPKGKAVALMAFVKFKPCLWHILQGPWTKIVVLC